VARVNIEVNGKLNRPVTPIALPSRTHFVLSVDTSFTRDKAEESTFLLVNLVVVFLLHLLDIGAKK